MKQPNEVALVSSGQPTVSSNEPRLSIVTGIKEKHGISSEQWKEYLKGSTVLDHWGY